MITSARIENFKGFKDLSLPDLSRITLLGGRNNVGKSSVLEALFLFHIKEQPDSFFQHFALRGFGINSFEPELAIAPAYKDYQMDRKISISVTEDNQEEVMVIEFNPSYSQKLIEVQLPGPDERNAQVNIAQKTAPAYSLEITYTSQNQQEQKSHLIVRSNHIELQKEYADTRQSQVTFVGARARSIPNDLATRFGLLDVIGKQDIVIQFLKILEPRLISLTSVAMGPTSYIHGDIGIERKIPVAFMGEGMDRLLSTVLTLATSRDGIILIDEFENGLHHSVMSKVWESISKAAQEFNCQIFATTHSYECLQAAYEGLAQAGMSEEFRYIRLDRTGDNVIAKTYSHQLLGTAIERGWEVR